MNFTSLEYFLELEHERSFSRAAEKLNISQQTLSGHIAAVEKEIGCRLFLRHVPLELTYAGQLFLRYARRIHRDQISLRQNLQEIREDRKGFLSIGIASTRGHAILPDILAAYQKKWPKVEVSIEETDNDTIYELLKTGKVDLGIAVFPEKEDNNLVFTDFYMEEIVLLMTQSLYGSLFPHRDAHVRHIILNTFQDWQAFASCPFLLNRAGDLAGNFARRMLHQADIIPEVRTESSNIETLLELCARGMGAVFTPLNLTSTVFTPQALEQMVQVHFGEAATYQIRFACLQERSQWKMLHDFIRIARKVQKLESQKE
jgi:DNA-binding transcriptional LysR family regulator